MLPPKNKREARRLPYRYDVTYTTPVPCEILRGATPTPKGVILERSEESGVACSRMTTQGEHGDKPHQACREVPCSEPPKLALLVSGNPTRSRRKNKGEAKRLSYEDDKIKAFIYIKASFINLFLNTERSERSFCQIHL